MRGRGRDDVTTEGERTNLPWGAATDRSPESVDEDIKGLKGNVVNTTSLGRG